jgi:hypothetical protein
LQIDAGVERLGVDAKEISRVPAQLVRAVAASVEEPAGIGEDLLPAALRHARRRLAVKSGQPLRPFAGGAAVELNDGCPLLERVDRTVNFRNFRNFRRGRRRLCQPRRPISLGDGVRAAAWNQLGDCLTVGLHLGRPRNLGRDMIASRRP